MTSRKRSCRGAGTQLVCVNYYAECDSVFDHSICLGGRGSSIGANVWKSGIYALLLSLGSYGLCVLNVRFILFVLLYCCLCGVINDDDSTY